VLLLISIVLVILLVLTWNRLRRTPGRPDSKPPESPHHFAPGQVSLLADHSPGLSKEQIAALAQTDLLYRERLLAPYDAYIPADRIATFEQAEQAFSLIPVEVPSLRQEDQLIKLINQLNVGIDRGGEPGKPPIYEQGDGHSQNGEAPVRQSTELPDGEQPVGALSFKLATPNWLAGGTPEPDGSGSPGARPMPPAPDVRDKLLGSGPGLAKFGPAPDLHLSLPREDWGSGVDVYILDTAPCTIDVERAYERWRHTNPLIASLLQPGHDRPLKIHYAGYSHLLEQADFYHPGHNYVMSDHGLFVAGIIHAIAPKAKLHLIEVLNPYGVGTLTSIANGFGRAAEGIGAQSKRVVNASLGLEVPQPRADWLEYVRKHDPFWQQFAASRITTLVSPLERICGLFEYPDLDQFGQPNRHPYVGVVAAAGNDHRPHSPLPPARYPAAHPSVLGVGALKHDNKTPAEYSNIADTPKSDGIATFGGDSQGINTDRTHGVVGAYIGAFPDGSENGYGLASWAGTSFATPRISGYIAALMSDGRTFADAVAQLRAEVHHPEANEIGEVVS
jgi:Subtilase family